MRFYRAQYWLIIFSLITRVLLVNIQVQYTGFIHGGETIMYIYSTCIGDKVTGKGLHAQMTINLIKGPFPGMTFKFDLGISISRMYCTKPPTVTMAPSTTVTSLRDSVVKVLNLCSEVVSSSPAHILAVLNLTCKKNKQFRSESCKTLKPEASIGVIKSPYSYSRFFNNVRHFTW